MMHDLVETVASFRATGPVVVEIVMPPTWVDRIRAMAEPLPPSPISHLTGVPVRGLAVLPPNKAILRWSDGGFSVVDLAAESTSRATGGT